MLDDVSNARWATVVSLISHLLAGCALGARRVPFETVAHGQSLDGSLRTTPQDRERFWGTGPLFAVRLLVADGTAEVTHLPDNVTGCTECEGRSPTPWVWCSA